ncbi:MAG: hypothetical protein KJ558_13705 [Gammaproteobacteria bacterium]|nr:hypothetical protein [Gammaproteobacteria bacterium]MBU1655847.1 hypothetical protein [Gammaproteobacteria bacterium]MBU1960082.1 hypothetical protein [Gammaproteobacteria bacterium]
MSIRTFIFCDHCNPIAIRFVEERRRSRWEDPTMGRRISDGRAWFDGNTDEARQAGWIIEDQHICPHCQRKGLKPQA